MKELLGKVIKGLYVNEDQSMLKFDTDQGDMIYLAEGDCCSETWFADIMFGWKFFNSTVVSVTEIDVPDWVNKLVTNDKRTRQEYDLVYGYQIVVSAESRSAYESDNSKSCDVIFRNSSNGYYYGWCGLLDESSKWAKEKLDEAEWTQITEDWQA